MTPLVTTIRVRGSAPVVVESMIPDGSGKAVSTAINRHRDRCRAVRRELSAAVEQLPACRGDRLVAVLTDGRVLVTFREDTADPADPDALAALHRDRVREAIRWRAVAAADQADPFVQVVSADRLPGGRTVLPDGTNIGACKRPREAVLRAKLDWCRRRVEFLTAEFLGAGWANREVEILTRAIERHEAALVPLDKARKARQAAARMRAMRARQRGAAAPLPDKTDPRVQALRDLHVPVERGTASDPIGVGRDLRAMRRAARAA